MPKIKGPSPRSRCWSSSASRMRAALRGDHTARLSTSPIEHLMVAGVVELVAAAHDAERRGHGALARGQDRTHEQELGFLPGWAGEQRCEGGQNSYNGIGQGEHGWTFREKWGQASLPCLYAFSKFCVKQHYARVGAVQRGLTGESAPAVTA